HPRRRRAPRLFRAVLGGDRGGTRLRTARARQHVAHRAERRGADEEDAGRRADLRGERAPRRAGRRQRLPRPAQEVVPRPQRARRLGYSSRGLGERPQAQQTVELRRPQAASPADALLLEEIARIRVYALFSLIMYSAVLIGLPFLGGSTLLKWILLPQMVLGVAGAGHVVAALRDPRRYRPRVILALAVLATATGYT